MTSVESMAASSTEESMLENMEQDIQRVISSDEDVGIYCRRLAQGLSEGNGKLLAIVEALGPSLTSTDTSLREKGVQFLSEMLECVPPRTLGEKEVGFLVDFYHDRLKDNHSMTPAILQGIQALTSMDCFPANFLPKLLQQMFQEITCQAQVHKDRRAIYRIIQNCFNKHQQEVVAMGSTFLLYFIQAVDGERDPRNLIIVFSFIPFVVAHFPLDALCEELFEVISCYFPVYLNQSSSHASGITREELAKALHHALSSTAEFAEFLFPLVMEKLDSKMTETDAKRDSLQLMKMCCAAYTPQQFKPYLSDIWRAVRKEVLMGQSEELAQAALTTLTSIVKLTSMEPHEEGGPSLMQEFLASILKECQHHLAEPKLRLIHPAADILQAVAKACDPASCFVLNEVAPLLLEQFTKLPGEKEKVTVLVLLTSFLKIQVEQSSLSCLPGTTLKQIPTVYLSALTSSDHNLRMAAVSGLGVIMREIMTVEERKAFWAHLVQIAIYDQVLDVRKVAVDWLEHLGKEFPEEIVAESIPTLLTYVTQGAVFTKQGNSSLVALSHVAPILQVASVVVPHLIHVLPEAPEPILRTLATIAETVAASEEWKDTLLLLYHSCQVISVLMNMAVKWTWTQVQNLDQLLMHAARVVRTITRALPVKEQTEVVDLFSEIFLQKTGYPLIPVDNHEWIEYHPFGNFLDQIPKSEMIVILEAAIAFLRPETILPCQSDFCKALLTVALLHTKPIAANSAGRLWATLVNKISSEEEVKQYLSAAKERLQKFGNTKKTAAFVIWVVKALSLRGHSEMEEWLSKMVDLLKNPDLAPIVAKGFDVIVSDTEESLNANCYCNVRLLYRQRFFLLSMQHFIPAFQSSKNQALHPYFLQALCTQLQHLPSSVVMSQSLQLLPLLLQSLDCKRDGDYSLHLAALRALGDLMESSNGNLTTIEDQLNAFLPRLLKLTVPPATLTVRVLALRCIKLCACLSIHKTYPHRSMMTRGLLTCLNDRKRLVRKAAVKARCGWYLLGPPEEKKQ